ncbi:MAG: hypothetical protein FWD66_08565 [Paludibacter sp.]|nr:hypothetical protein [Paludibacter sp.]
MKVYKSYILFIFSILAFNLNAQKVSVRATLDSATMVIGQQSALTFQIDQLPKVSVITPLFSDTLPGGLEIVGLPKVDTVKADDGLISIRQRYMVTAFEEAVYTVPKLPFLDGNDTIFSNSVSVKVIQPFQIDTLTNTFADIKTVMKPPFDWAYFFKITLLILLITGILVALVFIVIKIVLNKKVISLKRPPIAIPIDELTIKELDKIANEKLWQKGHVKQYYTRITEVLRQYIASRFEINAMEMTSDEIIENLEELKRDNSVVFNELCVLLRTADLVKFAKYSPLPDENERTLQSAYSFVNNTKKMPVQEDIKINENQ